MTIAVSGYAIYGYVIASRDKITAWQSPNETLSGSLKMTIAVSGYAIYGYVIARFADRQIVAIS